jgi:hypothetical protein
MAFHTQRPHVGQIALAPAFHDRHDVIRIPQVLARAPFLLELAPRCPIQLSLIVPQHYRIDAAHSAHAAIALEYLLA